MKISPLPKVRDLYEGWAESYAELMDAEIDLPMYADVLSRLSERIVEVEGAMVDTSCGSGHMLHRYRERFDSERAVVGIDLSPRMVEIARARLGPGAEVVVGDMRDLGHIPSGSSAAILSFFAIHHLSPEEAVPALAGWGRILRPGGQLLIAAWEGTGAIDYGGESDVAALRYTQEEIAGWAAAAGVRVDRCVVEPVEGMPMQAVYLEGTRT